MNKKTVIIIVSLYFLSAFVSFGAFAFLASPTTTALLGGVQQTDVAVDEDEETALGSLLEIDPKEPKDQVCPLNGDMYTQTERKAWEQRRPLAVMIENSPDARPQSGLGNADIVFEAMAEGGVTRFMAIFYCDAQRYDITLAPVRSARSYFIEWASGFNFPLYVHVGGANLPGPADALGQLGDYGWNQENDLNQFSIGFPTFYRNANRLDKGVATEHTMESSTEKLWTYAAEKRDWTNMAPARRIGRITYKEEDWKDGYTPWTFQKEVPADGSVSKVSYEFWDGFAQFGVAWAYNPEKKMYQRTLAGESHIDLNTDKQIEAANVIVLFATEKGPIDELKHMLYTTTGTGKATIFKNGEAISARWSKKTREDELTFTDNKGNDLELARGLTWISVVDVGTEITY